MKATIALRSASLTLNAGMPSSGRPARTTAPILSPRLSSATSFERVRSDPPSPPAASRPWQKPHCEIYFGSPARICSAVYTCGVTVFGGSCEAGLRAGPCAIIIPEAITAIDQIRVGSLILFAMLHDVNGHEAETQSLDSTLRSTRLHTILALHRHRSSAAPEIRSAPAASPTQSPPLSSRAKPPSAQAS